MAQRRNTNIIKSKFSTKRMASGQFNSKSGISGDDPICILQTYASDQLEIMSHLHFLHTAGHNFTRIQNQTE